MECLIEIAGIRISHVQELNLNAEDGGSYVKFIMDKVGTGDKTHPMRLEFNARDIEYVLIHSDNNEVILRRKE